MMTMALPYPPSMNRYLRHTGRTYKTSEAAAYVEAVAVAARGVQILAGDVALHVCLHPKLTKKGKASGTCIDLDNSLKVLLDALQGLAYHDDCQVKRIVAEVSSPIDGGGLTVQVFSMGQGPASPADRSESGQPASPISLAR